MWRIEQNLSLVRSSEASGITAPFTEFALPGVGAVVNAFPTSQPESAATRLSGPASTIASHVDAVSGANRGPVGILPNLHLFPPCLVFAEHVWLRRESSGGRTIPSCDHKLRHPSK